jgi:cytidyltransferase-like protein
MSVLPYRVYLDGVFDLFHVGHLNSIRAAYEVAREHGDPQLIVGVVSDADAQSYKRAPIIGEADRADIVRSLRCVHAVIPHCPLVVTHAFLQEHGIDLVVHGFADDADRERQRTFFAGLGNKFREIQYTQGISTTQLLKRLKEDSAQ